VAELAVQQRKPRGSRSIVFADQAEKMLLHTSISLTTLFQGKGSSMTTKQKVVWAVTIALGIVGSAALIINEALKQTAGYTR
jgi:hypothetical protein